MTPGSLRPILIVWPGRHDLSERLAPRLAEVMQVVVDRRLGERRRAQDSVTADRRRLERRHPLTPEWRARFRTRGYQLVYSPPAFEASTGDVYALSFCGDCERLLDFEMPRFVETPARVEAEIHHIISGVAAQHVVELEALTASGRSLLACRVNAREIL